MTDASGDVATSEGGEGRCERAQVLVSEAETPGTRRMPDNITEQYIASLKTKAVFTSRQQTKWLKHTTIARSMALFFTAALEERLRKWTSDVLIGTGHAATTNMEFNAYLGLEFATAI
ncbi:hypothetical protein L914_16678 [Phytophthora nicotianae]|uniref:PiggyBac transposable element-derived protein domain-containing protein n=4 Tax=Phytophthora nicotianae TaxID=4792 RepID=V9EEV4_PHYNI|nr:hypothetical protein F443_17324 [Phytophthora nicotianae P1569]ETM36684.1 hypothetical protein L914_16678 [Phytophthora nicotianae]ETO65315.1 hypothetical protein F444_17355 [Phytophthora nicotianae P1976]